MNGVRARGPDYVLRVGGRRAAPPARVRGSPGGRSRSASSQPCSSFHPPPPRRLWVLPFLLGAGRVGVIFKTRTVDIFGPRAAEG